MEWKLQAQKWFLVTALSYLGTPYIWGGDDPSGFDCSGFVLECLKSVGLVKEKDDYTADSLFRFFQTNISDKPAKGSLLFYLNDKGKVIHVVICLDEYFQIGASGGNNHIVDKKSAWRNNAYIKIRPFHFNKNTMKIVSLF